MLLASSALAADHVLVDDDDVGRLVRSGCRPLPEQVTFAGQTWAQFAKGKVVLLVGKQSLPKEVKKAEQLQAIRDGGYFYTGGSFATWGTSRWLHIWMEFSCGTSKAWVSRDGEFVTKNPR